MKRLTLLSLVFLATTGVAAAQTVSTPALPDTFTQNDIQTYEQYLLNNIATDKHHFQKRTAQGEMQSLPGAVIASPSLPGDRFSQDYVFHWVRDSAITMNEIAYLYEHATPAEKQQLKPYLVNYIHWEMNAQNQPSASGEVTLGQPKYNIDGTVWEGQWSRPQDDGPALRAISMIHIANIFLAEGDDPIVLQNLFNPTPDGTKNLGVIQKDLNYIAQNWNEQSYGPWEEVKDQHFFTEMVQRKALIEGAALAEKLHDKKRAEYYLQKVALINKLLDEHWNPALGYYAETLHQQFYKGGGVDSTIILAAVYGNTHDPKDPYAPDSDKMLSSAYFVREAFAGLYLINMNNNLRQKNIGPLIGRYPNDIYDGDQFIYGNPWILITNVFAEYYYTVAEALRDKSQIKIDAMNLPFFLQINPDLNIHPGQIISKTQNPAMFNEVTQSLITAGDDMLQVSKRYSVCYGKQNCDHLNEQIDRASGKPVSAKDLTWGYASVLSALQARAQLF